MKNYLLIILLAFLSNLTHSTEFDDKLELAKQGDASAQYNLGLMYATGEGVPENYMKAYVWWSMAKASGHEKARESIEIIK